MKKILCLIFSLLFLVGCNEVSYSDTSSGQLTVVQPEKKKGMQLLYSASDTFNPYTATTAINRELCGLLYDSLTIVDNDFNLIYALADAVDVQGTVCTVKIKNAVFSDGSAVTADDVVYSFKAAKSSAAVYAHNLYEVVSASAVDSKTVVFNLNRQDIYFARMLDFPILKAGSDTVTDVDGVVQPPVGCGRYVLSESRDSLLLNSGYYGTKGSVESIRLINAPDAESVSHYVEIGATDVYYTDIADGSIVRMSGKKTDINLTDFVYIGINENYEPLKNSFVRYALSSAIDREKVCQTAYYNNAVAANGFFHPDFKDTKSLQNIKKNSDLKISVENLEKIGYNNLDNNGYRANSGGSHLTFTLLVNSDNTSRLAAARLIASQLKEAGIELKIIERGYADYIAALQNGQFQLYLGEVRITANMDFSSLLVSGGTAAYGRAVVSQEEPAKEGEQAQEQATQEVKLATAEEIIQGFYAGQYSITDVVSVLLTELPAIPVCYRKGLLFYDSDVVDLTQGSQGDIYYSNEIGFVSS